MLTQYQLQLEPNSPCTPRLEWGYRLYAALLDLAPPDFAPEAHRNGVTPVSQYLTCGREGPLWVVTLLGEACEAQLIPVLESAEVFDLKRDRVQLRVVSRRRRSIADADELFLVGAQSGGIHRLDFRTPTAFKSRGQYLNLPTTRLIVQNLINKWNGCIPECPIEDEDGQGMEALAAGLRCRSFRLHDESYFLKGQPIPGFVGSLTMENNLSGFHRQMADALLVFAEYAGVGIKTTLGMGGVIRR